MCGEKRLYSLPCHQKWGSPPRMRGKANTKFVLFKSFGITPACAGKSDIPHPAAHYGRQVVRRLCRRFKRA